MCLVLNLVLYFTTKLRWRLYVEQLQLKGIGYIFTNIKNLGLMHCIDLLGIASWLIPVWNIVSSFFCSTWEKYWQKFWHCNFWQCQIMNEWKAHVMIFLQFFFRQDGNEWSILLPILSRIRFVVWLSGCLRIKNVCMHALCLICMCSLLRIETS